MDNGPLVYYPGSHRLPEVTMQELGLRSDREDYKEYERHVAAVVEREGLEPALRPAARRGRRWCGPRTCCTGARRRRNRERSRHSQVTHVFFEGCRYYTPMRATRTRSAGAIRCGSPDRTRRRLTQILYVYSREPSFVAIDRSLLQERWPVRDWRQRGPVVNLISLARAVARSDLVFGWFASWHTFWPVTLAWIMRKPSVVVIGGFDTARMPEIGYGLQQRRVMRHVSRWVMRRATRLVTNSHYSRGEAAATAGVDPARVTVVYHGVPDPFGELPPGRASALR